MIDQADPTIELFSRVPIENINGWNNTDVTLTWECTDGTSGVVAQFVSNIETAEGENYESTETCEDNAGNTNSDTQQVSIDQTVPTIIISLDLSSPDGENGWYVSDVGVTLTPTMPPAAWPASSTASTAGRGPLHRAVHSLGRRQPHGRCPRQRQRGQPGHGDAAGFMIDQTVPTSHCSVACPTPMPMGGTTVTSRSPGPARTQRLGPFEATVPKTVSA